MPAYFELKKLDKKSSTIIDNNNRALRAHNMYVYTLIAKFIPYTSWLINNHDVHLSPKQQPLYLLE